MNLFYLLSLILFLCLSGNAASADNEVLSLLKELKAEVGELKQQLDRSNSRIGELEKKLGEYRASKPEIDKPGKEITQAPETVASSPAKQDDKPLVTLGDVKGTFKIPGTNTSVGIGGYVKTDLLLNSVSAGADKLGDQKLLLSQIPVGGASGEHSQLTFHAKESRLWFKSFTPSAWGDINTYIEMDFFGNAGTYNYTPRLRHAYGSIGHFLAGQTWPTFLNAAAIPDILDNGGSAGSLFLFRQALVRWSQPFSLAGTAMEWQTAIEAPRSRIWDSISPSANSNDPNAYSFFSNPDADRYPDLVTRLNFSPEWGTLSIAAMGRQIRYTNSKLGLKQEAWGGAVSLAGKINVFNLDNIRFMAHYGNGHGRYVSTDNTFSDASLDNEGNLYLTTSYGGMLAYQHWWNKQWRSSVVYGYDQAEQPDWVNQVLNQEVQSLHANLLWSPVNQAVMGLEYIYANRKLLDGREGDLQRLQFSARYNF
ncbi:MAG: DcaP family trimeric outer membrane transporter [Methylicorpusculum sp.]|uniref:DcaP family trimeric outer membrane transporter n=1 Tax=Methylicorpusculum sp. TaxID=2713644 RepID=UPI002721C7B9|nr:DcaP family trimeric outer membrane transporter [Methylicorpusculum sp.]MDO8938462.1 DcaP family trimeric outer membrane transporter [Methylicorpusculum sp.]MDP2201008.1 DcaP family trimeric outer membrane transporter [Methylicorpusculum sp.]